MHLRSGRTNARFLNVASLDTCPWPSVHHACMVATSFFDPEKFQEYIRNELVVHMVEHPVSDFERKCNRLVLLATAQSLMNVCCDPVLRVKYKRISEVLLEKMETCPSSEFVASFRKFCL